MHQKVTCLATKDHYGRVLHHHRVQQMQSAAAMYCTSEEIREAQQKGTQCTLAAQLDWVWKSGRVGMYQAVWIV